MKISYDLTATAELTIYLHLLNVLSFFRFWPFPVHAGWRAKQKESKKILWRHITQNSTRPLQPIVMQGRSFHLNIHCDNICTYVCSVGLLYSWIQLTISMPYFMALYSSMFHQWPEQTIVHSRAISWCFV